MAVKDIFKITRKTFFNPLGWLGYSELKNYNRIIWSNLKELATPAKPGRTESFEEAMQRLNVTETDIQKTSENYLFYAIIFVGIAALAFAVGFILLIRYHTFSGFILAIACTAILLAFAFRFHFWHFQIKQRKLGCTFDEWWKGAVTSKEDKT